MSERVTIAGMPMPLRWLVPPVRWHADESSLMLEAGARTDMFVDPSGAVEPALDAPALVGDAAGDYLLSARVRVGFGATFDAGVLLLYAGERDWAKVCFEYSPEHRPMIVSVVTRGVSDDANAFVVDGEEAWLRVARIGPAVAFHASTDGRVWQLVRSFALADDTAPALGFEAQSPTGEGCAVTFDEIRFEARRLADLRDGS